MNADMLHVLGDEQRCTLTWRGSFAVPDEGALALVRIAVGLELPGAPIAWPEPAELMKRMRSASEGAGHSRGAAQPDATLPIASTADGKPLSLPFRKLPAGAVPSVAVTPAAPVVVRKVRHGADATLPVDGTRAAKPALPFLADPPGVTPDAASQGAAATLALPDVAPSDVATPLPVVLAKDSPAASEALAEREKKSAVESPWAPAPPAPPPVPPPRAKRPPPKIDVHRRLYGTDKR
jgi:hypothetical protein